MSGSGTTARAAGKRAARPPRGYGRDELAERLRLARWQIDRAVRLGLIPGPDVAGRRWSAEAVAPLTRRRARLAERIGSVQDHGATTAADVLRGLLAEQLGEQGDDGTTANENGPARGWLGEQLDGSITPATVRELHELGKLPQVGDWKGWPIYCGRTLERLAAKVAARNAAAVALLADAVHGGREMMTDEAAAYLGVRRVDVEHLVRAGLLAPAWWGYSGYRSKRHGPDVALYRVRDLDAAAAHQGIDWAAVRATPAGRRSPLALLPTAERAR
jgi:hypothetical protein